MQALPVYTDLQSLAALRGEQGASEGERLVEVAEQFSAVFTHMMLKSMRQASLGEGLFDSQQSEFYRDMFDQQLALELSQRENGGIANMLVDHLQQLTGIHSGAAAPAGRVQTAAYEQVQRWSDSGSATQGEAVPADNLNSRSDNWRGEIPR